MGGVITLSEKHGVNPSMSVCFFCGADKNEIILPGRLKGDAEAPHRAVWNHEPCDKCKEFMTKGVILISVRDGEGGENPYRTGAWCVVKDEVITRIFKPQSMVDAVLKMRVAFIEDTPWDIIGLPRGEVKVP